MAEKNVTFNDIAKYTHFSKTTISRYFNRPDTLTPKNQEIIRQALIDLNYKGNKVAQILAKGQTEILGVIVPNFSLAYFSAIVSRILLTYEEFGYKFLVFAGNENEMIEKQYLEELMSYQVEGLIVMSHTVPSKDLALLPVPVVSIEREDACISSVNCDNYKGGYEAAGLLAEHNCDILIHVNSPQPETVPAYQRKTGFVDFCKENSLPHELFIREMGVTYRTIHPPMVELLNLLEEKYPSQKKGIFFSNDTLANIFLNLLIRRYHGLPDSYRIVGFDNSPAAKEAVYTISTAGQQIRKTAWEAVHLLDELIRRKKADKAEALPVPIHKVIPPVIYRRETTEGTSLWQD